ACASVHGDIGFVVEFGRQTLGVARRTQSWDNFAEVDLGVLVVREPGDVPVRVRPKDAGLWQAVNLRTITLIPE
ncbi:MAG TPA: hypothetical protein PKH32_04805, partial [Verrucomicrobiota bacterium]|nr:hypothetical protein [Verrucomicrobiota bacterium]